MFATEVSDASGTNLLDVTGRCWSGEILDKLEIDRELLPEMYESCEITGEITTEAARLTGLKAGTPVASSAGDNAAAAIGTGVAEAVNHSFYISRKVFADFFAAPATLFMHPHGQIPVKQRTHRLNACRCQFLYKTAIKGKSLFVDHSRRRNDTRPTD